MNCLRHPAVILCAFLLSQLPARAGYPATFDDEQREIAATVRREMIERLAVLGEKIPELSGFSNPDSIEQSPDAFHYRWKGKQGRTYELSVQHYPQGGEVPSAPRGLSTWMFGGRFGGINERISVSAGNAPPFQKDVADAIEVAEQGTQLRLTVDYDLRKAGVSLDIPSLISAAASRDDKISEQASIALRFRKLTDDQLAEVVEKSSVAAQQQLALTIHTLAGPNEPRLLQRLAERCVEAEKSGTDAFSASPWDSASRDTRFYIAGLVSSDAGLLPAASFLIAGDPDPQIRKRTLESVLKLPASPAQNKILEAALKNPDRRIQAAAAEALVDLRDEQAAAALGALLASPAADVRTAAKKALLVMGRPNELPNRKLPDAARDITKTLRKYGLTDADIVCIAARPSERIFPPAFDPKALPKLPEWVTLKTSTSDVTDNGKVVGRSTNYSLELDKRALMLDLSPYAVKRRAGQYACGFGLEWGYLDLDPTGPFLLAAALEIGDEESASLIYERMAVEFPTDADALDRGLTIVAWLRFDAALDAYRRYRDDHARKMFADVLRFKPIARPFTLIANYIAQTNALLPRLDAAPQPPPPVDADAKALVRYWIARIPEINGDMPGQPASPAIWQDDFTLERGFARFPFASDELRKLGPDAIPALIEVSDDQTPSRTVGWWRDFKPERYVLDTGSIAREIIFRICQDAGITPPKILTTGTTRSFVSSPPIAADLRKWWWQAGATAHSKSTPGK